MIRLFRSGFEFRAADVLGSPEAFEAAVQSLRVNGLVVLRGFYEPASLTPLREAVYGLGDELEDWRDRDPRDFGDGKAILSNAVHRKRGGYKQLASETLPIINVREGEDSGLVDIFRPEAYWPEYASILADQAKEGLFERLVSAAFNTKMETRLRNVYLNRSVTRTRGFHVDGYKLKAKGFVYLSDVLDKKDGPYCYAVGSHASEALRKINVFYNERKKRPKDDFPVRWPGTTVPILGKAGDAVLSMQTGAHRGIPQEPGRERVVLVQVLQPRPK